jgi:hypothetical protein
MDGVTRVVLQWRGGVWAARYHSLDRAVDGSYPRATECLIEAEQLVQMWISQYRQFT